MIAITICATERYAYALTAQARRVQAAVEYAKRLTGYVIISGDNSKPVQKAVAYYKTLLPDWEVKHVHKEELQDSHKNYKEAAQLTIAQLRTAAFTTAITLKADQCWSLDSDVLPPANALQCMQTMLDFDDGYYGISTCLYPSQGGGGFLGGRGTPEQPILPDWYEKERVIPDDLAEKLKKLRDRAKELSLEKVRTPDAQKELQAIGDELGALDQKIKECPPKGNVYRLNADEWEQRGWFEQAYPAVGKGAIVPTDWCGFGCALIGKKALLNAQFDGYAGQGTEDLFVCFQRWYPHTLRVNVISHCLCDHVVRNPGAKEGDPNRYVQCQAYHETGGKYVGHIRLRHVPFYTMDLGEKYQVGNDGKLLPPPKEEIAVDPKQSTNVDVSVQQNTKHKKN